MITPKITNLGYSNLWTDMSTILGYASNFNQQIQKLFSNGEQGFFYDPNDLSTMYQDAAGTIPVTASGQPVGLMLDKSKGVELGSNIIVNGDASQGLDNWSTSASTLQALGDSFLLTASTQYGTAYNNFAVDINKTYIVEVEILNNTAGNAVYLEAKPSGENLSYAIKRIASIGKHSLIFSTTISDSARITITDSSTTPKGSVEFKVLSVREIKGNHAYQTVSASRPILQRNATTGAYYLAFDGTDDSLVTNNIDFTSTDKMSLFAGIRKLSDTAVGIVAQFGSSFSSVGGFSFYTPTSVGAQTVGFRINGTTPYAKGITGLASPRSLVFSGQGDIAAQRISARVDGVERLNEAATVGTGNFGNYSLGVGRLSGAGSPFNGHLYSLIGIGRLTTDAETASLEKSIAKNTGVTLNV